MPCFHPLRGYRASRPNQNGKFPVVFTYQAGFADQPISLPCGQCVGCRLERSRQWALRCVHESKLYDKNCFVTLTYSDACLPDAASLVVEHHQLFMKRLKSAVRYKFGKSAADGIRFYMCGEYGERFGRPHYHFLLFNWDFPDKRYKRVNSNGDRIFESDFLSKLWPDGQTEIGSVTYQSAAYVARYIMKKITGDDAVAHYGDRIPEYTAMSNGIGKNFFRRFATDMFPSDFLIHDGKKHRIPRYYDSQYEIVHDFVPSVLSLSPLKKVKSKRRRAAAGHADDNTPERRSVREKVQLARLSSLKRGL